MAGGALTQYHYDGAAIHQSFAGSNWQTPSTRTVHGLAIDTPLLHHAAGQRLTFHQDVLGSVIATTDAATGQVRATQGFDAFGNLEAGLTTSARVPTYGYTGREPDATGLTYFRARYYQPSLGRFTQADPAGFIDGVNRYTYALNAPVNFTDPMGLAAVGSVGGTARGVSSASTGGNGWLGWLQGGLDVVGAGAEYVLPGPGTAIGTLADVASAGISWWQGDNLAASASLAAALPYVGAVALIAKASKQVDGVVGAVRRGPSPNGGVARPHGSSSHNNAIDSRVEELRQDPSVSNIRKNQQQVDVNGAAVGRNRPDIQYDRCGTHYCVEYDVAPRNSTRHGDVIRRNDPDANVELNLL